MTEANLLTLMAAPSMGHLIPQCEPDSKPATRGLITPGLPPPPFLCSRGWSLEYLGVVLREAQGRDGPPRPTRVNITTSVTSGRRLMHRQPLYGDGATAIHENRPFLSLELGEREGGRERGREGEREGGRGGERRDRKKGERNIESTLRDQVIPTNLPSRTSKPCLRVL